MEKKHYFYYTMLLPENNSKDYNKITFVRVLNVLVEINMPSFCHVEFFFYMRLGMKRFIKI
jgi:hypothetical protein